MTDEDRPGLGVTYKLVRCVNKDCTVVMEKPLNYAWTRSFCSNPCIDINSIRTQPREYLTEKQLRTAERLGIEPGAGYGNV